MSRGRFGPRRLAFAVVLVGVWFLSLRPAVDFDYGWHVANGRHLFDGVLLGGVDVYSWTARGAPWVAHEWTVEALMAAIHDSVGASGNSIAAATVVAVAIALVGWRVWRRGAGAGATATTMALAFATTLVSMGVRPQLLELVYLAATLLWLDLRMEGRIGRPAFLAGAAIGALVWANSHGSFPVQTGVFAVGAAATVVSRNERWKDLAMAAAVAAIVPLLNPWSFGLYAFVLQLLSSTTTHTRNEEWLPPALLSPSFLPFTVDMLLCAIGAVLLARHRRRSSGFGPLRLDDLAMAAVFAVLGLRAGRHVMLFGVAAAPLIAESLGILGQEVGRRLGRPPRTAPASGRESHDQVDPRARDILNSIALVVITGTLAVAGWARVDPTAQANATAGYYPVGLLDELDAVAATLPEIRLLNEYTWGGFLVLHRPHVPVFIDGRGEVYGEAQLARYASLVGLEPGWEATLEHLGVNVALLPTDASLSRALGDLGWRTIAGDDVGVLLVRP